MLKRLLVIALICCTIISVNVWANTPEGIDVGRLQVLEDPGGKLQIDKILMSRENFRQVQEQPPNYYFSSSTFWFCLPVHNKKTESVSLFLDIQSPALDYITFHVVGKKGRQDVLYSGDRIPARDRPVPDATTHVFPFQMHAGESVEIYVRVHAEASVLIVPFHILDANKLQKSILTMRSLHLIVLGVFIALFIHNLFMYILLRENSRLYFLLYLPFAYFSFTAINGFGSTFIYPGNTWLNNEGVIIFFGFGAFFSLLFSRVFLPTSKFKIFDYLIKLAIVISFCIVFTPFLLPLWLAYQLAALMLFFIPLLLLIFSAVTWFRGFAETRFYMLANGAACIGLLTCVLMIGGIIPFHYILLDSIAIGISTGALLLSLSLADRIRMLQTNIRVAENTALKNLEVQKEELEKIVAERTNELENARRQAELQATTDALTGIYNRRGLFNAAERDLKITLRYGRPLSIVIFDLDHFKSVNDKYGHDEGDRVLREVSRIISGEIRSTDLFGRIGGEEFLLVMPDTGDQAAYELAERLRVCLSKNVFAGPQMEPVTASFGVASLDEQHLDINSLFKAADNALYNAKQNGRNRVETGLHRKGIRIHEDSEK